MNKLFLAICLVLLSVSTVGAAIDVDYEDIYTFKSNYVDYIIYELNETEINESGVYEYTITAIDNAWVTYAKYPLYIYALYDGQESSKDFEANSKYFQDTVVKKFHGIGKKRFLKAIYSSMRDVDLSATSAPDWMFYSISSESEDVIYLLEVNISELENEILEDEMLALIEKIDLADASGYMLVLATYVTEFDELVVDVLFTDEEGNVKAECILVQNDCF